MLTSRNWGRLVEATKLILCTDSLWRNGCRGRGFINSVWRNFIKAFTETLKLLHLQMIPYHSCQAFVSLIHRRLVSADSIWKKDKILRNPRVWIQSWGLKARSIHAGTFYQRCQLQMGKNHSFYISNLKIKWYLSFSCQFVCSLPCLSGLTTAHSSA